MLILNVRQLYLGRAGYGHYEDIAGAILLLRVPEALLAVSVLDAVSDGDHGCTVGKLLTL